MGKTVPSYMMALEFEIEKWSCFRKRLQTPEEREGFDALMDMCRKYAIAAGNVCDPFLFEPMAMSILLGQQKEIRKLEEEIRVFLVKKSSLVVYQIG
jgi:hypothetical protein